MTTLKEALRNRYANLGLGEKAFDGVAAFLLKGKTVSTDEDINALAEGEEAGTLLRLLQSETDTIRTRNSQLSKELDGLKNKVKPDNEEPEKQPDIEKEDGMKTILARMEALEKSLKDREDTERLSQFRTELRAAMKSAGSSNDNILDLVTANAVRNGEETAEDAANRLKADYDATYRKFYGNGTLPPAGGGTGGQIADEDFKEALIKAGKLPKQE